MNHQPVMSTDPTVALVQKQEHFTNRTVNTVVIVLGFIAYFPALLDERFYQLPWQRISVLLLTGVCYVFAGTWGVMWAETRAPQRPWVWGCYFLLQMSLILLALRLSSGINHNLWLLILPVAAQSLVLPRWGTVAVSALLLFGIYLSLVTYMPTESAFQVMLQIGAALVFTVLFSHIVVRESVIRSQMQQLAIGLQTANSQLAGYAAEAEEIAIIKERNRLAREIHDNLGHYLTVINVQLEAARLLLREDVDKAETALNKAQRLTQEGLTAVRESISSLRESPLEGRTLIEALQKLAEETQQTGIVTRVLVQGTPVVLEANVNLTLYRIVQEGLTNVRKHARASQAELLIDYSQVDMVHLRLQDNGVGTTAVDSTENYTGFGLIGIRERTQLLGGTMHIETSKNGGFSLSISIPINQTKNSHTHIM